MGLVYLEHGLVVEQADALSVDDNFIAECGSCIELRGWGQASKVTDNLIGAGSTGVRLRREPRRAADRHNNVFPRGASSIAARRGHPVHVTGNRLHSFYPGMVILREGCSENLVASNHLLRDDEPWAPFAGPDNGLDDTLRAPRHPRGPELDHRQPRLPGPRRAQDPAARRHPGGRPPRIGQRQLRRHQPRRRQGLPRADERLLLRRAGRRAPGGRATARRDRRPGRPGVRQRRPGLGSRPGGGHGQGANAFRPTPAIGSLTDLHHVVAAQPDLTPATAQPCNTLAAVSPYAGEP